MCGSYSWHRNKGCRLSSIPRHHRVPEWDQSTPTKAHISKETSLRCLFTARPQRYVALCLSLPLSGTWTTTRPGNQQPTNPSDTHNNCSKNDMAAVSYCVPPLVTVKRRIFCPSNMGSSWLRTKTTPHMKAVNQMAVCWLGWYFRITIGCGTGRSLA